MPPKVKYRIDAGKKGRLLAIAAMADVIQLLFKVFWFTGILAILSEAVGWATTALGYFFVSTSLAASRVNPFSGKKVAAGIATGVAELIPLVNGFIPGLTIWTAYAIRQSRAEDKEKAVQSATIERREEALQRAMMRRVQRKSGGASRPEHRMRRTLRNIPHPAFKAAGIARGMRPKPLSRGAENTVL